MNAELIKENMWRVTFLDAMEFVNVFTQEIVQHAIFVPGQVFPPVQVGCSLLIIFPVNEDELILKGHIESLVSGPPRGARFLLSPISSEVLSGIEAYLTDVLRGISPPHRFMKPEEDTTEKLPVVTKAVPLEFLVEEETTDKLPVPSISPPVPSAEVEPESAPLPQLSFSERGLHEIAENTGSMEFTEFSEFADSAEFDLQPESDETPVTGAVEETQDELDSIEFDESQAVKYHELYCDEEGSFDELGGASGDEDAAEDLLRPNPRRSLHAQIKEMTVNEKIQLALRGNRSARSILLKDPIQVIHQYVLKNPRLTKDELVQIARSPHISTEVIRQIAVNSQLMGDPSIRWNIIRHPKVNAQLAIGYLKRLSSNQLSILAKGQNVRESISRAAKKILEQKRGRH